MDKQINKLLQQYKDLRFKTKDEIHLDEYMQRVESATKEKVKDFSETLHNYFRTLTGYSSAKNYFNKVFDQISEQDLAGNENSRLYLIVKGFDNSPNSSSYTFPYFFGHKINILMGYEITDGKISDLSCYSIDEKTRYPMPVHQWKYIEHPISDIEESMYEHIFSQKDIDKAIEEVDRIIESLTERMIKNLNSYYIKDLQQEEKDKMEIER